MAISLMGLRKRGLFEAVADDGDDSLGRSRCLSSLRHGSPTSTG